MVRKYLKTMDIDSRKKELSEIGFRWEALVRRSWQVHSPTQDIEIDCVIGKNEYPLNPEVQLRSTWEGCDGRYNFELHGWKDDPKKFFAYFVIQARASTDSEMDEVLKRWETVKRNFYVVPMSDIPKIEPFKIALESDTWKETGAYKRPLTPEQIEEFLSEYKDDKGWALMEARAKAYKG